MSVPIVLPTDTQVLGTLTATQLNVPLGAITDTMVAASANIAATKLQQEYHPTWGQESSTTAFSETHVFHVVRGSTGTIIEFAAGSVVPAVGSDTCNVDVTKNGSFISGSIVLNSSDTARTLKFATLTITSLAAGDVLEIKITPVHTTGTLPKGVFARLTVRENSP
jgi:hypothetical protein